MKPFCFLHFFTQNMKTFWLNKTTIYQFRQCFLRGNVDTFCIWIWWEHSENCKLSTHSFTTACWSSDENVIIWVVHCIKHYKQNRNITTWIKLFNISWQIRTFNIEHGNWNVHILFLLTLCLDGIEEREFGTVKRFKSWIPQSSDWQWLQV